MERQSNVCVLVGPNGNLTTLIAGLVSLHPSVLAVNHGVECFLNRHFTEEDKRKHALATRSCPVSDDADFVIDFSEEKLDNFVEGARALVNEKGEDVARPKTGTDNRYDVMTSHTFNRPEMQKAMNFMFPDGKDLTEKPGCIFWKEGMLLTKLMLRNNPTLKGLDHDRVKFILPIRNPVHTYYSCQYKGFHRTMKELNGDPLYFIFYCLKWMQTSNVDCMFFNESQLHDPVFYSELSKHMGVPYNFVWSNICLQNCKVKSVRNYSNEPDLKQVIARCKKYINELGFEKGTFIRDTLDNYIEDYNA